MQFTVIAVGGSITPIEAQSADEAVEIIERSHGWKVAAVVGGEVSIDGYTHHTERNRRWYLLRPLAP